MENTLTEITNYLATQSWQIAVLATAIAGVSLLLKNKSAHVRYLLWLIVLAKCLTPSLLTIPLAVLPQQQIPQPAAVVPAEIPPLTIEPVRPVIYDRPVALAPPTPVIERPSVGQRLSGFAVRQWLPLAWIGGLALFFSVTLIKALRTNSWLQRARRPLPAGLKSAIDNLFGDLDIRVLPKVWLIKDIGQPFVWGLLRGGIYLPADFAKLDSPRHRRGILGHELSHVLRFDAAVNLLQIIVQGVFWFHPLVWWANKKIRAEREKCCDEMAIARLNAKAKDYSTAIVNTLIAEHKSAKPIPSLAVAGPVKNIEDRIKTILKPDKKFYKRPSFIVVITILLLALVAVPTTLALTARPPKKTDVQHEERQEQFKAELPNGVTVEDSRNLLMERKDILKKTLQTVEQKYNNGRANSRQLQEAKIDLLRIESELSETPQKRIDILGQIVTLYLEQEKTTKLLLDAGRVTQGELNKVKYLRLDAENEFARAKAEGNEQQTDFKAILPNDVTVELVGVCEHPSEGKQWWRPDGTLTDITPYDRIENPYLRHIFLGPRSKGLRREFALRLSDLSESGVNIRWHILQSNGSLLEEKPLKQGNPVEGLRAIVASIPIEDNTVRVDIGVASGPWKTTSSGISNRDNSFTGFQGGGSFSNIHEQDGKTILTMADTFTDFDHRVIAIDKSEAIYMPTNMNPTNIGKTRVTTVEFDDLPLENVKEFQFQTRPYEWVKFKNVSLRAGLKTDVQVEVGRASNVSDADKMASEDIASEGWELWRERKLTEAERLFKKAVEKDPTNANAWNGLGWSQQNQGKPLSAKVSFERCLEIQPKHAAALNGLGWIAKGQGKTDEAIGHWEKAVAAAPSATAALNGLATTYMELKQYDRAIKYYEMWLGVEPDNSQAKTSLQDAKAESANLEPEAKSIRSAQQELGETRAKPPSGTRRGRRRVELFYDDGSSEGRRSIPEGGHAVIFDSPGEGHILAAVRLSCSPAGASYNPAKNFHICLLDDQFNLIKEFTFGYSDLTARRNTGTRNWVKLLLQPVEVPSTFAICVGFDPTPQKPIHIHYDDSSSGNSFIGLPGQKMQPFTEGQWMIRAVLHQPAENTAIQNESKKATKLFEIQQTETAEMKTPPKAPETTTPPTSARPSDRVVYRQLEKIFDLSELHPEMHFADALDVLKSSVEPPLNVYVFWNDLYNEADVDRTSPINIDSTAKVPLKMAFNLLLDSVSAGFGDLTYVVADGLIYIGPKKLLRKKVKTSVHRISDVIGAAGVGR